MLKELKSKIRRYFVLRYARNNYNVFVKEANRRYETYGYHYYVCLDIEDNKRLIIFNRAEFRRMRRMYNNISIKVSTIAGVSPMLNKSTMVDIKNGCFYTTNQCGYNEWLTPESRIQAYHNDMEARRLAYLQYVLDLSESGKVKRRRKMFRMFRY